MSRPLQAGEVGRVITATDLGVDWAGLGYTLKLHIINSSGTLSTDNSMVAVGGSPMEAEITTTATMFPTAGTYRVQVVAYSGATTTLRSEMASIVVLGNT